MGDGMEGEAGGGERMVPYFFVISGFSLQEDTAVFRSVGGHKAYPERVSGLCALEGGTADQCPSPLCCCPRPHIPGVCPHTKGLFFACLVPLPRS